MSTEPDLLLPLYRAARSQPTAAFQALALRMVQPLVRFESAVWASGYRTGTDAQPALVPVLALSYTHATDPAGVAQWRQINQADKAIPIMLAHPFTTCRIHSPTLFAGAEDAAMRDYTRRFGRQCALVTGLGAPGAPLIEWSVLYRPDADDHFSTAEAAQCERLMLHLSEALCVNRLVQRVSGGLPAEDDARSEASALVGRDGELLAAGEAFLLACRREWTQFDSRRLPSEVMRHLVDAGRAGFCGRHLQLHGRPVADLWWLTAATARGLPARRMNVAALFARGQSHKSIAKSLGLSPSTVRNHIAASYRDLGVCSRTALKARREEAAAESWPR